MESTIRRFDWYRRVPKDLTESSVHGSIISIAVLVFTFYLVKSSFLDFLELKRKSEMYIDNDTDDLSSHHHKLKINLDIRFRKIPCSLLSLDVTDVMGSHDLGTEGTLYKISLAKDGESVISKEEVKQQGHTGFSGLSRHNWNIGHMKDEDKVRRALLDREGCRIQGSLEVNKVPGNLHIATHSTSFFLSGFGGSGRFGGILGDPFGFGGIGQSGSDSDGKKHEKFTDDEKDQLKQLKNLDISHDIEHLSFGHDQDILSVQEEFTGSGILNSLDGKVNKVKYKEYKKNGPGSMSDFDSGMLSGFWSQQLNPISKEEEGKTWKLEEELISTGIDREKMVAQPTIVEYYCSVVPTSYRSVNGVQKHVYQFTANSNKITNTHMPSIYIRYGLSPVTVRYSDYRQPFYTFIVQTMGIVGGLFTVAGLIESMLHQGIQSVQKKFEMGKLG